MSKPVKSSNVCSVHFLSSDYHMPLRHILMNESPRKFRRLKPDAVTSLHINSIAQPSSCAKPIIDRSSVNVTKYLQPDLPITDCKEQTNTSETACSVQTQTIQIETRCIETQTIEMCANTVTILASEYKDLITIKNKNQGFHGNSKNRFIPLIRAVSLRIDGLIDLGPNWSYEYRIMRSSKEDMTKRSLGRHGKHHHSSEVAYLRHEDEKRFHKDKKKLRKAEQRLREEAERLREARDQERKQAQIEAQRKQQDSASTNKYHEASTTPHKYIPIGIPEERQYFEHRFSDIVILKMPRPTPKSKSEIKRDSEPALIHLNQTEQKREKELKPKRNKKKHTLHRPSTWSSMEHLQIKDDSTSLDTSELKTTKMKFTMLDMDDFTTRKKKHKMLKTTESKTGFRNKFVVPFVKDSNKNEDNSKVAYKKIENVTNMTTTNVIRILTTTQVTTVRTAEIFSDPHKVKDNDKINEFNDHIYKHSLKVFDIMKQKASLYRLKKQADALKKSYEDKFKEFLRETSNQKIKTRLGTQKVILNTIDTSNQMLKRLTNFMIGDNMNNMGTAKLFRKVIDKEHNLELNYACKNIGICRTQNSFSVFLTDILEILLGTDDRKLKQSIDAMTEVVKNADFDNVLGKHIERKLKVSIDKLERLPVVFLRPLVMIIKNIIQNKNSPIILTSESLVTSSRVNGTLAFLEIIDLLDKELPPNEANTLEWNDIKTSFKEFSEGKRDDVQEIMEVFVKHVNMKVEGLDKTSKKSVSKNMEVILKSTEFTTY